MRIDLTGKTAVVTGSSQGIGFATALGLARAGARSVLTGRNQGRLDKALARIRDEVPGADVLGVTADLATAEGARILLDRVPAADILVNNLGIFGAQEPLDITDADWRRYFEVNVLAAVRVTRAYLPGMTERGWGRIQYIASDSAIGFTICSTASFRFSISAAPACCCAPNRSPASFKNSVVALLTVCSPPPPGAPCPGLAFRSPSPPPRRRDSPAPPRS